MNLKNQGHEYKKIFSASRFFLPSALISLKYFEKVLLLPKIVIPLK